MNESIREQLKVWLESVVRPNIQETCADESHLALLQIGQERGDPHYQTLGTFCFSVLASLANYDDFEPLPERMEDMDEPQMQEHLARQLRFIKGSQTDDTIGSMLIVFMDNGITQYGATIDPEGASDALRELADQLSGERASNDERTPYQ